MKGNYMIHNFYKNDTVIISPLFNPENNRFFPPLNRNSQGVVISTTNNSVTVEWNINNEPSQKGTYHPDELIKILKI